MSDGFIHDNSLESTPYELLGTELKQLREQLRESLAEVSGAVEIEVESLERIEQGIERPSEDILLLLISHFNVQDDPAMRLWELAGYDRANAEQFNFQNLQEEIQSGKPVLMLMALDMRTLYSDTMQVHIDNQGVVLHFGQANGQKSPLPVSRVGMSVEQAQNVVDALQRALLHARYLSGPKRLTGPKQESSGANENDDSK